MTQRQFSRLRKIAGLANELEASIYIYAWQPSVLCNLEIANRARELRNATRKRK